MLAEVWAPHPCEEVLGGEAHCTPDVQLRKGCSGLRATTHSQSKEHPQAGPIGTRNWSLGDLCMFEGATCSVISQAPGLITVFLCLQKLGTVPCPLGGPLGTGPVAPHPPSMGCSQCFSTYSPVCQGIPGFPITAVPPGKGALVDSWLSASSVGPASRS